MSDSFFVSNGELAELNWKVMAIRGVEALSELFSFTMHVGVPDKELDQAMDNLGASSAEGELLDSAVRFRIGESGIERYGLVTMVTATGKQRYNDSELTTFRITVSPRMWRLTRRRNSRIFQALFVHEIVSRVLHEHGVAHRWSLNNTYAKRIYCTQFEETDFEFVARLLAEEGILFFFEHREAFSGGDPPTRAKPKGLEYEEGEHWQNTRYVTKKAGELLGDASEHLGNLGGGAANLVSDLVDRSFYGADEVEFITGVTGEAGPAGSAEVMVFVDQAGLYGKASARDGASDLLELEVADEAALQGRPEQLTEFARCELISSSAAEIRDYDFRKPLLELKKKTGPDSEEQPLEVYQHHGEYERPDVSDENVRVVLEQHRAEALGYHGRSLSPRVNAGHVFKLTDPRGGSKRLEGNYAVVRVFHRSLDPKEKDSGDRDIETLAQGCATAIQRALHDGAPVHERALVHMMRDALDEGDDALTYENRLECVPAELAYRPALPRRRMRNVVESATVVGPPGEEIFTDECGRIKVQFHWDRQHEFKGDSSCWIRVMHPWAGAGWGFQFIPRVGMEVLVSFIGGDPDRPVVLGSLYNQTHPTPEPTPQRKTRSGVRTQSSPGGSGSNELSFEDAAGQERVYVQAHRDMEFLTGREFATTVGGNQTLAIMADQRISIVGNHVSGVANNHSTLVGQHCMENVAGNRAARVACSQLQVVEGDDVARVDGLSVRSVRGDGLTQIDGHSSVSVGGDATLQVGGASQTGRANLVAHVQGSTYLTSSHDLVLRAEKPQGEAGGAIRLECGDSVIEITGDTIRLRAANVVVDGVDSTKVLGGNGRLELEGSLSELSNDRVRVRSTAGGRLDLTAAAQLGGANVSLTGPAGAPRPERDDPSAEGDLVSFVLQHGKHPQAVAIADVPYRVLVGEEDVQEGTTAADGTIEFHAPGDAKTAKVTAWAHDKYPNLYPKSSGPLEFLIHLVDELPSHEELQGARMRLRNLAYQPGTELAEEALDPVTAQALREFQAIHEFDYAAEERDNRHAKDNWFEDTDPAGQKLATKKEQRLIAERKLRRTGELDDNTKKALKEVYGG